MDPPPQKKKNYNFPKKVTIYPQFVKMSRKYVPIIDCRESHLRNFVVESSSVLGLGMELRVS